MEQDHVSKTYHAFQMLYTIIVIRWCSVHWHSPFALLYPTAAIAGYSLIILYPPLLSSSVSSFLVSLPIPQTPFPWMGKRNNLSVHKTQGDDLKKPLSRETFKDKDLGENDVESEHLKN